MTTASNRRAGRGLARPLAAILSVPIALVACAGPALDARHREQGQSFAATAPSPESAPAAPDAAEAPFAALAQLEREPLVREVLRRNPSLEAARQAWKAALERYPQESSLDDPMLATGVGPASFGSGGVDDAYRLELSQRFPFPGKLALRGEVALAEAEAKSFEYEAARLRIGTIASLLFDDYTLAARSLAINAEHLRLLGELRRVALGRYEAGRGTQQDPLQAETESAELLHQETALAARQTIVRAQINALLHRPSDTPLPPPPAAPEAPRDEELAAEELTAAALLEQPELRAARARVEADESGVALARREFLPDFSLNGGYDRFWQERDLRSFVGISVDVPLQIGRRRAALEEARARLSRARSERDGLEDQVRLSVATALERLREVRHLLELSSDRLLPAARDRVAAARAAFEAGSGSFLELIEAERTLRNAELGYYEELANLGRRRAALDRAVGRLAGGSESPSGADTGGGQP